MPVYPQPPTQGPLASYWTQPLSKLVEIDVAPPTDAEQERGSIYCNLVMGLVAHYWNGACYGRAGEYPWGPKKKDRHSTYLGHNIACIAVDRNGRVLEFAFNHNELFNSSVEHAESRIIRRLFSRAELHDSDVLQLQRADLPGNVFAELWNTFAGAMEQYSDRKRSESAYYPQLLRNLTVYTSLEPCAQCAGILGLAYVRNVVYLQPDPGQFSLGNILHNLNDGTSHPSPMPVPAEFFGVPEYTALTRAYQSFQAKVATKPFYVGVDGRKNHSQSITNFLCTDKAKKIFVGGQKKLLHMKLKHPQWKPSAGKSVLTNRQALDEARAYYRFVTSRGRRGSPHKL